MKPPFSLIEMLGDRVPHLHFVDVGAMYLGPEHIPYRQVLIPGRSTVIGFEALKEECDKLNASAESGHRYLPYCIGDGTERTFYVTNSGFTSSLYEPNTEFVRTFNNLEELMRVVRREKVQTVRLDDVSEIRDVHFLKLDVQGAELDILKNASRVLDSAMLVYCEVEFVDLYKGQPLFAEIDQFLRSRGFMLHFFNGFGGRAFKPVTLKGDVNLALRQMLWSDAIYVPDIRRLHTYPPDRLLALAVILHELYVAVDLVSVLLNHYDRQMRTDLWSTYLKQLTGRTEPGERPALAGLDA